MSDTVNDPKNINPGNPMDRANRGDMASNASPNPLIIQTSRSKNAIGAQGMGFQSPLNMVVNQENRQKTDFVSALLADVQYEILGSSANIENPSKKHLPHIDANLDANRHGSHRLGVMQQMNLEIGSEPRRVTKGNYKDLILSRGFKDNGLGNLIQLLESKQLRVEFRRNELIARSAHSGDIKPISIPLFSNTLGVGRTDFQPVASAGEFMFKGGSVASVTAQVASITREKGLQLPVDFSTHLYDRLTTVLRDTAIGAADIGTEITKLLNANPDFFGNVEGMVNSKAMNSAGYVDALQYAGGQKLGRHHLGHANQILLAIDPGSEFAELAAKEMNARVQLSTANKGNLTRTSTQALKRASNQAKEAVAEHLKELLATAEGTREKELAERLNLAWASQSGEWLFHDNRDTIAKNQSRGNLMMIKMTSSAIQDLSILPGQDLYEKQRQFHLSRGVVQISSVNELPASVAKIMGFNSSTMQAIKTDMAALGARETNVALGRRTLGIQFLDSRLNEALFGDSGALMSQGLIEDLDIDPTTGHSRHRVTTKISLKQLDQTNKALAFTGVVRTDIAEAILTHADRMDSTGTIRFQENIALEAHNRLANARTAALNILPDGRVVVGEKAILPEKVRLQDTMHANDIVRDVRSRGLDPSKVEITGARILPSSGELELIMTPGKIEGKNIIIGDSGYIYNSSRLSVGQVVADEAANRVLSRLGLNHFISDKTGLVFGDIGLGPVTKQGTKTSYGFNSTLLGNLAELIARKESDLAPTERKLTKALLDSFGGDVSEVVLGQKKKLQFLSLGSGLKDGKRISDSEFSKIFAGGLNVLKGKGQEGKDLVKEFIASTFVDVDAREIFKLGPGFDSQVFEEANQAAAQTDDAVGRFLESIGVGKTAAAVRSAPDTNFIHKAIVSLGGEISVRDEEPLAKLGTKAHRVTLRQIMYISESLDFARGQNYPGLNQAEVNNRILSARGDLFKELINSHPSLFKKNHDFSLMYQLSTGSEYKKGTAAQQIAKRFRAGDRELGTTAIYNPSGGKISGGIDDMLTFKSGQTSQVSKGSLREALSTARSLGGKLTERNFKDTVLGLITESAQGNNVAQVSDQMLIVQGPNGPMFVPSAKAMGFKKEKGFLRIPGGSQDFGINEEQALGRYRTGQTATKEAQLMYLNILEDIESMEEKRLTSENVDAHQLETIDNKLNRLYKVMATNSLSKQGMYYNAALDPEKLAMAGRFRLQTHADISPHQVGVTKDALTYMFEGSMLKKQGTKLPGLDIDVFKPGTKDLSDDFLRAVNAGEIFTYAFREPIAGGRQMMAMQLKLIDDDRIKPSGASHIKFVGSAFLHPSMVKYGMEGDFDKDSVTLFRLMGMDNDDLKNIHLGQKAEMEGILDNLKGSRKGLLKDATSETVFKGVDDVMNMLHDLKGGMTVDESGNFRPPSSSVRDFSIDALLQIVQPKHHTPIIEAYMTGRSYVDHMMANLIDIQVSGEGRELVRTNFLDRLSEEKRTAAARFLDQAQSLFVGEGPGFRGGRFASYNYSDARNLTKYMFLKKAAYEVAGRGHADTILTDLYTIGTEFSRPQRGGHFSDEIARREFIETITDAGDANSAKARQMVDSLADSLLQAAGTMDQDKVLMGNIGSLDTTTYTLLHNLVDSADTADQKMKHAQLLAKRMIFTAVMSEELKGLSGNMPGEGIIKDLSTILRRLAPNNKRDAMDFAMGEIDTMGLGAQNLSDIQGLTSDLEYIDRLNSDASAVREQVATERRDRHIQNLSREQADRPAPGEPNSRVPSSASQEAVTVPNSSVNNSLRSGEFFKKFIDSKFFKPVALIAGGLAGLQAIDSAIDRFSPGNVPTMSYSTANTMLPSPMLSSPQDPTFARDAIPNTNVARLAKHHGQRNTVNVSGKMDRPVDFRGMANQTLALNNGYMPNIQGSFRSTLNDTMSQAEMSQFVNDRMGSSF